MFLWFYSLTYIIKYKSSPTFLREIIQSKEQDSMKIHFHHSAELCQDKSNFCWIIICMENHQKKGLWKIWLCTIWKEFCINKTLNVIWCNFHFEMKKIKNNNVQTPAWWVAYFHIKYIILYKVIYWYNQVFSLFVI